MLISAILIAAAAAGVWLEGARLGGHLVAGIESGAAEQQRVERWRRRVVLLASSVSSAVVAWLAGARLLRHLIAGVAWSAVSVQLHLAGVAGLSSFPGELWVSSAWLSRSCLMTKPRD